MSLTAGFREFYRASPMREGVLCWYPFEPDSTVLDLSDGALTELLKRCCRRVVTVGAGDERFDYIVAVDPADFSVKAITELRAKLSPRGRLLIAYENPFALRFWAGKRASNTGLPYDTLFGHGNCPLPSKAELQKRLSLAGFGGQKWYYPLTDHWLTMEVYSESCLPNEYLNQRFAPYIADDGFVQFDERGLYREVIRGGAFEFMCGAYLVEARSDGDPCAVDYAAVTAYREPAKRFATVVRNDGIVYKMPLHPDGWESVCRIHNNHEELAGLGLDIVKTRIEGDSLVMPRLSLPTLWDYWAAKLTVGAFDEDEMIGQFDSIRDSIYKASANGKCYWELVPANCFYDEGSDRIIFFDQEYYWENASPDIALARAVKSFAYSQVFKMEPRSEGWIEFLKNRYGLSDKWDEIMNAIDTVIFKEVFGEEYQIYPRISDAAAKRINERTSRLNFEKIPELKRYERFCPATKRLRELGIEKPLVYGFGRRGRTLKWVFEDFGITDVVFIDKKFDKYKTIDDLPSDTRYDAVIVSIWHGGEVADELINKTHVPVYTLGELIGEDIE